ncbi:hypothetical protein EC957_001870 [Mortierella hygrophila]|uniref:Protein kinase domain-containing protein n=1 Tax=Mortierella hygrophila TaxID=979708 RepID=A0A9P6F516_9FUNG|nr:hypothetical protein EC957_001870 [Mortierella hygrophila]
MQLKMANFRLAEDSNPSVAGTMKAGALRYWALEVVMEEEHTVKTDTFSLGIIFYNMSTEVTPRITTNPTVDNYLDGFAPNEETKDLIARTLVFDVDQRIEQPDFVAHKFLRHVFNAVPNTAFDVVRVYDNDSDMKYARALENNGENPGAWK